MIAHITTAHPRTDTRIRLKEVDSLESNRPGDVRLYVQDGLGDEIASGDVSVIDTGPALSRYKRATLGCFRMFAAIVRDRPKVAHFHDPEFLPWGVLLRLFGIKVVYDVHEDLPRQVRHSRAIPESARPLAAPLAAAMEWFCTRWFSAIVAATPEIHARFRGRGAVLVRNFPMTGELVTPSPTAMSERPHEFAYVGSIGIDRSSTQIIRALAMLTQPALLNIAGSFPIESEHVAAKAEPGWRKVNHLGEQNREQVAAMFARCRAGLVLFQPLPNNIAGRPNKLFEYMSAGLPVIASDFPRWREIVEGAQCGLLVDPRSPEQIAEAMNWMLDNPDQAEAMGHRGRQAILANYSWQSEERELLDLYARLLNEVPGKK